MAYENANECIAAKTITISTEIESFDPLLERTRVLADRLQKLHERIHGSQPQEVLNKDSIDKQPHNSVIGSIKTRRAQFGEIIDRMDYTIRGIESGV